MTPKIAQVITRMVPGGASRIVQSLIQGLSSKLKVDLITGEQDLPLDLQNQIKGVRKVHTISSLVRQINPFTDLRAFLKLKRLFESEKYDAVHTHTSKAGFLGRWAARFAGIPGVVHSPHGLIYLPESEIPGVPQSNLGRFVLLTLERWTSLHHDMLTTLSHHEKRFCVEEGLSEEDRTRVVPNGIKLEKFRCEKRERETARSEFEFREDDLIILSVGRLSREKGHKYLIESFQSLSQRDSTLKLMLVGKGPLEAQLKKQSTSLLKKDRIHFPGYLQDVEKAYFLADIFVLPSLYEGFGLSLVEAMAAGLPVVATKVGGVPELIREGKEGLLVPPADAPTLTNALQSLVDDPELRSSLANNANARAQKYSITRMLNRFCKIYQEILPASSNLDSAEL